MFSFFLCLSPSVGQVEVIPTIVRKGLIGNGGERPGLGREQQERQELCGGTLVWGDRGGRLGEVT